MPFHYSTPFSEDSLIARNRNIVQSWKVCAKSSHTTLWKVRFKSLENYISIVLQIFLCSIFSFSRKVHCIFSRCKITVYRFFQQKNKTNRTIIRSYCYVFAAMFLHFHKMSLNLISLSRNFANAISIFIQRKTYALRCSATAYFSLALALWKTTRRFYKSDPSFWWKQPVVFFVPRNTFFIKKLTSIIFQGHTTYSQNESSQAYFPQFFKEIIPQNLVNRQKYHKFATQSLQNNLLKAPFCAQFGSLRR